MPPAADMFEDELADDEFEDDGIIEGGTAAITAGPSSWPRAVGHPYIPRFIGPYQDVAFIRHARTRKEHTLFYGPPGTGKSAGAESAFFPDAKKRDDGTLEHLGLHTIVCSADTTEADFLGTFVQDPETRTYPWIPGPLMRAVLDDVPLFVDEILLADPRVLSSCLYPLMDGRDVLRIPANPQLPPLPVGEGFFVIGAGNPDVPGAQFSEALRDRFHHHIEVTTDWALARKLKVPSWIVSVAKELDKERERGNLSWSPQMRALLAFRDDATLYGVRYAVAGLVGKAPVEDQALIRATLVKRPEVTWTRVRPLRLGGQRPGTT